MTPAKHTPGLCYDGFGINDSDEYRSRLATFTDRGREQGKTLGPLLAAAPELLQALEHIKSLQDQGLSSHEVWNYCLEHVGPLVAKAKGGAV